MFVSSFYGHESVVSTDGKLCAIGEASPMNESSHTQTDETRAHDLATIDRVADVLLACEGMDVLYPRDTPGKLDAIMRGLRVLFPDTPDAVLAERLSAAYLATL